VAHITAEAKAEVLESPPTRVFGEKSLDFPDPKGVDLFRDEPFEAQGEKESARDGRAES
jgi:hypothetical protein